MVRTGPKRRVAPRLAQLVTRARRHHALRVALVNPVDAMDVAAVREAGGLIRPVLIGPRSEIERALGSAGQPLGDVTILDAADARRAAEAAVELAVGGKVDAVLKGSIHTDEFMRAIVGSDELRTDRRMSHVAAIETAGVARLLFVSDGAVHIAPDLAAKRDITQNAIDVARAAGVAVPKVAILAAVETVSAREPATIDAAALAKMADRKQITGGLVDGPLALDDAISPEAARLKGIDSAVAGYADVLIAPDLDAANLLFKEIEYFANGTCAEIVVGARVPIVLTSRADDAFTRVASIALAILYHRYCRPAG